MPSIAQTNRLQRQFVIKRSYQLGLGRLGFELGVARAASIMSVSGSKAAYWRRKYIDPLWKPNSHGGSGRHEHNAEAKQAMSLVITRIVNMNPTTHYRTYRTAILDELGYKVSESYVSTLIKALGYTYEPLDLGRPEDLTNF